MDNINGEMDEIMEEFIEKISEELSEEPPEDLAGYLSKMLTDIDLVTIIYHKILSLTVYRNLVFPKKNPTIVCAFSELLKAANELVGEDEKSKVCEESKLIRTIIPPFKKEKFITKWSNLCITLLENNCLYNISAGIGKEILYDENIFSVSCAKNPDNFSGLESLKGVKELAKHDLKILESLVGLTPQNIINFVLATGAFNESELAEFPTWSLGEGFIAAFENGEDFKLSAQYSDEIENIKFFHSKLAFGKFIDYKAFLWRKDELIPVSHPDPICLADLKEYSNQKNAVIINTKSFLSGNKANNILLYGDRGTGKSSTVKAILNEYYHEKLRLVELSKSELHNLPQLTEMLVKVPLKFIVFIDDLSFNEDDEDFSMLKAVLEGGASSLPKNVIIYATSNRRHLVKESFSARQGDELHRADTIQETVSLSDRFGIVLTYFMPAKREFLEIVEQMAKDEGIEIGQEELFKKAESWAIQRGARSPRYARQFIVDLKAKTNLR